MGSGKGTNEAGGWEFLAVRHAHPAKARESFHALQLIATDRPSTVEMTYINNHKLWLRGEIDAPPGPWVAMVRLRENPWIQILPSRSGLVLVEQLANLTDLYVLHAAYDSSADETMLRFYKRGKRVVDFRSAGSSSAALNVRTFESREHPKSFLTQFHTVGTAVTGLIKSANAPDRRLSVSAEGTQLCLRAVEGTSLRAHELAEVTLRTFVPLTAAENPASVKLQAAITHHDPTAVRRAIAAGASLEFLPELPVSPLVLAMSEPQKGDWQGVIRTLVEAGAPVDGYRDTATVPDVVNDAFRDEASTLALLDLLVELGANINPGPERTQCGMSALHNAVMRKKLGLVKWLVAHGARLDARDDILGRTPLDLAAQECRFADPGDVRHEIRAFLESAAAGTAQTEDAKAIAGQSTLNARKQSIASRRELRDGLLAVAKAMAAKKTGSRRLAADAATLTLPDSISLEPNPQPNWRAPRKVSVLEGALAGLGFEKIGAFRCPQAPGLMLLGMRRREGALFAMIYEAGRHRVVDLMRFHRGGGGVVAAGGPALSPHVRPLSGFRFRRFNQPNFHAMLNWLLRQAMPAKGVVPATVKALPRLLSSAYRAELVARKRVIRSSGPSI